MPNDSLNLRLSDSVKGDELTLSESDSKSLRSFSTAAAADAIDLDSVCSIMSLFDDDS